MKVRITRCLVVTSLGALALVGLARAVSTASPVVPGTRITACGYRSGPSLAAGEVTVVAGLSVAGDPLRFRWHYSVKNNSYDPNPVFCNGLSGLHLEPMALILPDEFGDFTMPNPDWSAYADYYGMNWVNQFGVGLLPGESGEFSFTTLPRKGLNANGYYHTHFYGAPVYGQDFPIGGGPLGPGPEVTLLEPLKGGYVNLLRDIPPNGYRCNEQPPYDYDYSGDGVSDSWYVPVVVTGANGSLWQGTDEHGNQITVVGIPDESGAGCGQDHYSGRLYRPSGPPEGEELGSCVYACGRNSFLIDAEDNNGNEIPDRFLSTHWRSQNGDDIDCPFTGEVTYFDVDLTKEKIVVVAVERIVRGLVGPETSTSFVVADAVMVDLGTNLAAVVLDGEPIGLPSGGGSEDHGGIISQIPRVAVKLTSVEQVCASLTAHGTIANTDVAAHVYGWSLFGIGAVADTLPPIQVAAGETLSFDLQATLADPAGTDTGAVLVLAYAETGDVGDIEVGTIVFESSPAQGVPGAGPADPRQVLVAPNPMTVSTSIQFPSPPEPGTRVDIIDVRGRTLMTLDATGAGDTPNTSITWDGSDFAGRQVTAGIYFIWVRHFEGGTLAGRLVVLR